MKKFENGIRVYRLNFQRNKNKMVIKQNYGMLNYKFII